MRLEDQMTEAMPETGTCLGDDWTRGHTLGNQRIAFGENWSLGYLERAHSGHLIAGERSPPGQKRDKFHCTLLLSVKA